MRETEPHNIYCLVKFKLKANVDNTAGLKVCQRCNLQYLYGELYLCSYFMYGSICKLLLACYKKLLPSRFVRAFDVAGVINNPC